MWDIFGLGIMVKITVTSATLFQKGFFLVIITLAVLAIIMISLHSFGQEIRNIEYWHNILYSMISIFVGYLLGANMNLKKES